MLLNKGFSAKAVSVMLGHSSTIITTNIYFDKSCIVIDCTEELNRYIEFVKPVNNQNNVLNLETNFDRVFKNLNLV